MENYEEFSNNLISARLSKHAELNLKGKTSQGGKRMFDFSVVIVGVLGVGSLAFSFLEYALTRKKKQQNTETN